MSDKNVTPGPGWRPPLYTPKGEHVWFDGKIRLPQQPIVVCPGRNQINVYTVGADGRVQLMRWRRKTATEMYWLGVTSVRELIAGSLVDEGRAITGADAESPAYYRRQARKKRTEAQSLEELLVHLKLAIRRSAI